MKKQITVSAPGKLMLLGEHAVIYNRPCLVTAVSSRMYVEIEKNLHGFSIDAPQVKDVRFVKETVEIFKEKYRIGNGLSIKTQSDFSSKYGFGSSSAVTVATIYALNKLYNIRLTKKEIFDLGYTITLSVQGIGSGFDIAAATFGKTLYFTTGGKVIESLDIKELPLVIGYSGMKADTPKIVKSLKLKMKNYNSKLNTIFKKIEAIVNKGRIYLLKTDWIQLGHLMNENHTLLQELEVSTTKLDAMCEAAVSAGALGAKLSGAGGGDCMIALVSSEKRTKVEEAILQSGGEVVKINNNTEGVIIE